MKKRTFAIFYLVIFWLCACSNGGNTTSSGNQTTDASKINIINPNTLLSLSDRDNYGYVMIFNPTTTAITGLTYSLSNTVGGGSQVKLDPVSTAACGSVAANGRCPLKLIIPAGTIAGSIHLTLNNQPTGTTTGQNNVVIGVTQVQYANSSNEVHTYFYPKVVAGTKYVMVTGFVPSQNVTPFNVVHLTDGNGNPLPGQEAISGNLGAGLTNLGQGGTFSILLPVSHKSSNQTINLKLSSVAAGGTVKNQVLQKQTSNIEVVEEQRALINTLPSLVDLTTENPNQTITIYNSGNKSAQLQSLETSNSNLKVSFSPTELAPGATTTATVSLNNPITSSVSSGLTLRLNNGLNNTSHAITVEQNINQKSSSTLKTLSTSKAGTINTQPYAGLVLNFTPNFVTNTTTGTITNQMVLTNTGNTPESNFVITLPNSNFSILEGGNGYYTPQCQISGNTIQTTLGTNSSNNSCSILVSYTNNQVTPETSGDISISYQYYNASMSTTLKQPVNYEVTQGGAILNITPNQQSFGSILNNGVAASNIYQFVVYNSGQSAAKNVSESIIGSASQLFNIVPISNNSSACGASLASGKFCIIGVQFGPTVESGYLVGNSESANLIISYNNLANIVSESSLLIGNVVQAIGANISASLTESNNFYNGPGTSPDNAYQIAINATGSLTYTYTNSGTTASNFYITANNLPSGWSISNNNCGTVVSPITLNNNVSCTITFQLVATNPGSNNLPQNLIQANWSDQTYPKGTSLIALIQPIYVNAFNDPVINVTTSQGVESIPILPPGESLTITSTLIGGYQTSNLQVNFISSESFESLSANSCTVNSINSSCSIVVSTPMVAPNPTTPVNGPITISLSSSNSFLDVESVYINATSTFNNNWEVLVPGSQQVILMSKDTSGNLYYADMNSNVWVYALGKFTNTGFTSSGAINAIAAENPTSIGVGTSYPADGSMGEFYLCDGNDCQSTSPWLDGPIFPTSVVYSPTTARFYWGDSKGEFHYFSASTGGISNFADEDGCDGVLSSAISIMDGSMYYFAQCVDNEGGLYDEPYSTGTLYMCDYDGSCNQIDKQDFTGSLAADENGNVYASWGNLIISYQNSNATPITKTFINPSSMPSLISPTLALLGGVPEVCNSQYVASANAESIFIACNVLIELEWSEFNSQLLALYNFANYTNIVSYSPNGIANSSIIFPALPEKPFAPLPLNGGMYGSTDNLGMPSKGDIYSPTTLITIGNTVYYMGASGTIYSLQY